MTETSVHVLLLAAGAIMVLAVIFGVLARFYGVSSHGTDSLVESEREMRERTLAEQEIDHDEWVRKHPGQPENKHAS